MIYSYSNGYVLKYELLEENTFNDLIAVKIRAYVVKGRIVAKINSLNGAKKIDGKSLYAQLTTRLSDNIDAQNIILNLFEKSIYSLYRVELLSNKTEVEKFDGDKIRLSLDFKIAVDIAKYFDVVKHQIEPVFDKVSIYKYELTVELSGELSRRKGLESCLENGRINVLQYDTKWNMDDVVKSRSRINSLEKSQKIEFVKVGVCTRLNTAKNIFYYTVYCFDARLLKNVFRKCYLSNVSLDVYFKGDKGIVYKTNIPFSPPALHLFARYTDFFGDYLLSPLFVSGQHCDYEVVYKRFFDLKVDVLAETTDVKFELIKGD